MTGHTTMPVRHVIIGIPARDEAETIVDCLRSVIRAAAVVAIPVHVVVADDGSTDGTDRLARSVLASASGVSSQVVTGRFGTAGGARMAALDTGVVAVPDEPMTTWLATTDADTVVADDWVACHLHWADRGLDAIAGLVDVAWHPGQATLARRYAHAVAHAGNSTGHHHVHGANLGLRANRWAQVAGCGDGEDGEDGELWRRLRAAGVGTLGVTDLRVRTSARVHGRVAGGFSGYLRALDLVD